MGVFSTHLLSPSVSWRNAGLFRGWCLGHLAACASRDEISPGPTMENTVLYLIIISIQTG